MPAVIRMTVDNVAEHQIRHRAKMAGMPISEYCCREIKKGLVGGVAEMPSAIVDQVERGSGGGRAVAAYLSPPLSNAIARLARETQRSSSHVMRGLLRDALRARGILPTPGDTVPAPAETELAA